MARVHKETPPEEEEILSPTPGLMKGDLRYEHNTFGMIHINRTQGTPDALFGSSVTHSNSIRITISRAEYNRSVLGYDSYFGKQQLMEIELSPNQFASAITNMNAGGTPCTLRFMDGKYLGKVPKLDSKKAQATDEFRVAQEKFVARFSTQIGEIQELIEKGRAGKGDLKKISDLLGLFKTELTSNQPFHMDQFIRGMDIIVNEARAEIESHLMHTIHAKGLEVMQREGGLNLQEATEDTPFIQINE